MCRVLCPVPNRPSFIGKSLCTPKPSLFYKKVDIDFEQTTPKQVKTNTQQKIIQFSQEKVRFS